MLYLEDYLEMIEHLPGELRDRFTEMRELDLTVHNSIDSIEKKCRNIFSQCKRGELNEQAAEVEFNNLRQEFYKALEDADEKVNIATHLNELVERYLRRLDSELYKFKCELEADNNGITDILERRSLELENNSSVSSALLDIINSKENQDFISSNINTHGLGTVLALPSTATNKESRYRIPKVDRRRDNNTALASTVPEKRANMGNNNLTPNASPASTVRPLTPSVTSHVSVLNVSGTSGSSVSTPSNVAAGNVGNAGPVPYNLQQLGGSASTAIAAAASQAIVATQQMQQGRRTASLKASYEAIHGAGGGPTEFWISRDIANAANVAAQNTTQSNVLTGTDKKQKKKLNSSLNNTGLGAAMANNVTISSGISIASSSSSLSVDSVDMLPTNSAAAVAAAACSGGLGVSANNNTTLNSLGFTGLGATTSAAANAAVAVSSSSRGGSASSSSSSVLAPSANLTINENGLVVEHTPDGDWTYDPNEPRYCTCNQVSYGDMVACDNDACPYEWFHYPCVGITQPPKGKWYCPKCTVIMRRRGSRKN